MPSCLLLLFAEQFLSLPLLYHLTGLDFYKKMQSSSSLFSLPSQLSPTTSRAPSAAHASKSPTILELSQLADEIPSLDINYNNNTNNNNNNAGNYNESDVVLHTSFRDIYNAIEEAVLQNGMMALQDYYEWYCCNLFSRFPPLSFPPPASPLASLLFSEANLSGGSITKSTAAVANCCWLTARIPHPPTTFFSTTIFGLIRYWCRACLRFYLLLASSPSWFPLISFPCLSLLAIKILTVLCFFCSTVQSETTLSICVT